LGSAAQKRFFANKEENVPEFPMASGESVNYEFVGTRVIWAESQR